MGVLGRFEARIERLVSGAFAKAFKSDVEPVEIASALARACDERAAIVSRDRTMVPNSFVVELGHSDHERLAEYSGALGEELAGMVSDHADEQRYSFIGPVTVAFEEADDLETGVFRVRGTAVAGVTPTHRRDRRISSTGPDAPPTNGTRRERDDAAGPPTAAMPAPTGRAGQDQPDRTAPRPARLGWLEVGRTHFDITAPVVVLGRGNDVDLRIDDPGISRRHAEIRLFAGAEARVLDLGSTNGLLVDGQATHQAGLQEGTTIRIGSTDVVFHAGERVDEDHDQPGSPRGDGQGPR